MTQGAHGERIASLEAMHAMEHAANVGLHTAVMERLDNLETHMNERFDKIEVTQGKQAEQQAKQDAKMQEYENKGKGILIGIGLLGTAAGAAVIAWLERIFDFFK